VIWFTASSPDPHSRLTVAPPTSIGQQGGHAGDVAVVLAGLVGRAEGDVLHRVGRQLRIAVEQAPQDGGGQVVGADARQPAPVAADRRTAGVDDEHVHDHQLQS
jgi:hypothetical protein